MSWTRLWALLNLLGLIFSVWGGLFLSYSLTLKPSNFRLVKIREKELAICLDDKTVVAGYDGPLGIRRPVPGFEEHKPYTSSGRRQAQDGECWRDIDLDRIRPAAACSSNGGLQQKSMTSVQKYGGNMPNAQPRPITGPCPSP